MREIKFRGKDIKSGMWAYGDLHTLCDQPHIHTEVSSYPFAGKRSFVNPDTIGQFTGLKDNNGKEIYEGDIIRFKYEDYSEYNINGYHHPVEIISAVTFEYGEFRIQGYPCRLGACYDWAEDECEFEVIGNIHDNPELIKQ